MAELWRLSEAEEPVVELLELRLSLGALLIADLSADDPDHVVYVERWRG